MRKENHKIKDNDKKNQRKNFLKNNDNKNKKKNRQNQNVENQIFSQKQDMMDENQWKIIGRNPVTEALKADRNIDKILIAKGSEGSIKKIEALSKEQKVPIAYVEGKELDRVLGHKNHQGVIAYVSPYEYCEVEDILKVAEDRKEKPFIIILDGIEDPHNLGAIMRSAEICGAHGIIIPKRRTALLNETVAKVSAGAIEYMKCAKVSNIVATIDRLKEKGLWIYQSNMGGTPYYDVDLTGGIVLVIGSEGKGVSKLVAEHCDFTVTIPMYGNIYSLNASNAATVVMCEVARQRN